MYVTLDLLLSISSDFQNNFRYLFVYKLNPSHLVYIAYVHASQASKYPGVTIYGGSNEVPALTKLLQDKDEFSIGDHIHVR